MEELSHNYLLVCQCHAHDAIILSTGVEPKLVLGFLSFYDGHLRRREVVTLCANIFYFNATIALECARYWSGYLKNMKNY